MHTPTPFVSMVPIPIVDVKICTSRAFLLCYVESIYLSQMPSYILCLCLSLAKKFLTLVINLFMFVVRVTIYLVPPPLVTETPVKIKIASNANKSSYGDQSHNLDSCCLCHTGACASSATAVAAPATKRPTTKYRF